MLDIVWVAVGIQKLILGSRPTQKLTVGKQGRATATACCSEILATVGKSALNGLEPTVGKSALNGREADRGKGQFTNTSRADGVPNHLYWSQSASRWSIRGGFIMALFML